MLNTIGRILVSSNIETSTCLLGMLNTIGRIRLASMIICLWVFARYVKYNR